MHGGRQTHAEMHTGHPESNGRNKTREKKQTNNKNWGGESNQIHVSARSARHAPWATLQLLHAVGFDPIMNAVDRDAFLPPH